MVYNRVLLRLKISILSMETMQTPMRNFMVIVIVVVIVEIAVYLGTTVTNQNLIHEGSKSGLNSGIACNHSVQNLFVFSSAV
jgi:hypothetical protein